MMWLKWLTRRAQALVVFQAFAALFCLLILIWTLSGSSDSVRHNIGELGATVATGMLEIFGIAALLIPFYLSWNIYRMIRKPSPRPVFIRIALMFILMAGLCMYLECFIPEAKINGFSVSGILGLDWGHFLSKQFGLVGGTIVLTMILSLCGLLSGWIHMENAWVHAQLLYDKLVHIARRFSITEKPLPPQHAPRPSPSTSVHVRYSELTGPFKTYKSQVGGHILEPLWSFKNQSAGETILPVPPAPQHPSTFPTAPAGIPVRQTEKTEVISTQHNERPTQAEPATPQPSTPMQYLSPTNLHITDSHGVLALNQTLIDMKRQMRDQPRERPSALSQQQISQSFAETAPASTDISGSADAEPRLRIKTLVDPKTAFSFPLLNLLKKPARGKETSLSDSQLDQIKLHINKVIASFGVQGSIIDVINGPRLRTFEFQPDSGTKISQLQNVADDLSVALGEPSIRIVAPIPGRKTIGLEIPRKNQEIISLRDLLNDSLYQMKKMHLPIVLGKDIYGAPVVDDLASMPHLLVAGATGAGKSIFISTILTTWLYSKNPHELNLALVDPKMIELAHLNGIPHLVGPVLVNQDDSKAFFIEATQEMARRYQKLSDLGTRDIESFNRVIKSSTKHVEEKRHHKQFDWHWKPMPYLVIIVDELADLMMTQGKEVEVPLTRLAQKARACGIHLILATQRPSHEVLTGLIKANFPSRVAFKVSASHDSRTIIDQMGAEKLLGKGDMLFLSPGKEVQRIHAPFITEEEAHLITAHWKKQKS